MIHERVGTWVNLNLGLEDSDLVRIAEDCSNLLQLETLCVWEDQEHNYRIDCTRDYKCQVELPADSEECDGGGLQPDDIGQTNCRSSEANTLCTQMGREELAKIRELGTFLSTVSD
jgi:hypothetical protein